MIDIAFCRVKVAIADMWRAGQGHQASDEQLAIILELLEDYMLDLRRANVFHPDHKKSNDTPSNK